MPSVYIAMKAALQATFMRSVTHCGPKAFNIINHGLKFEEKVPCKKVVERSLGLSLEKKQVMKNVPANIVLEDHCTKSDKSSFTLFTTK